MKSIFIFKQKVPINVLSLIAFICMGFVTASCRQDTHTAMPAEATEQQEVRAGRSVRTVIMPVEGMSCGSCVASINKTVKSLEGVQQVKVSLEKRQARVTYAPEKISPEQISEAIRQKGYKTGRIVEIKKPE